MFTNKSAARSILENTKKIYAGPHCYRLVEAAEFSHLDLRFYENTMLEIEAQGFRRVADVENLTVKEGASPEDLLKMTLGIIDYEILGEKQVKFECNCSFERAVQLIASLGKAEVRAMLEEDRGAVMNCGFCNNVYTLDENDLQKILESESA